MREISVDGKETSLYGGLVAPAFGIYGLVSASPSVMLYCKYVEDEGCAELLNGSEMGEVVM
jgi:hypothetical protein